MLKKSILVFCVFFYSFFAYANNFEDYIRAENPKISTMDVKLISQNIIKYSAKRNHDPVVILVINQVESDFNRWARSKGNYGLMQINRTVWIKNKRNKDNLIKRGIVGRTRDLYIPYININAGTFIFQKKKEYCQNWIKRGIIKEKGYINLFHCAVSSYNGSKNKAEYYAKVVRGLRRFYKYFHKTELTLALYINESIFIMVTNGEFQRIHTRKKNYFSI